MKREELLQRLQIYKREIYRRAYIVLLAGLLPVIIVFVVIALESDILQYGIWGVITFFAAFLLFMTGLIWWFAVMVNRWIPKKVGLLCPECNTPILKNKVDQFMENGLCTFCGAKILED